MKEERNEQTKANNVSMEKKLFHALHAQNINSPTLKEFHESWAFMNSVRSYFFQKSKSKMKSESENITVIIDVAGGHGALAALFLLLVPSVKRSIVIDPAVVTSGKMGIRQAWFDNDSDNIGLEYRHESLFTGLPSLLNELTREIKNRNILVVACHACQHLSDATMDISEKFGVHVAVMPCCQKDHSGSWKAAARNLGIGESGTKSKGGVGIVMDLLSAGKMMNENAGYNANVRYNVKMKVIDSNITPQNRLIMCKSLIRDDGIDEWKEKMNDANIRLERAYERAHKSQEKQKKEKLTKRGTLHKMIEMIYNHKSTICIKSMLIGVGVGFLFSIRSSSKSRLYK